MSQTPTRLVDPVLGSGGPDDASPLTDCLIRPLGIIHGPAAELAVDNALAIRLAGTAAAFTTAEIVEGAGPGAEREFRSVRQVALMRAPNVVARLRFLTDERPPVSGLNWSRPRILAMLRLTGERGEVGERSPKAAVERGRMLAMQGADIVAVTATGHGIDEFTEVDRIAPVIGELAGQGIRTAVCSSRPTAMRAGARAGARLVIDESPRIDDDTLYTLGDLGLPVILRRSGRIGAVPRTALEAMDLATAVHAALESRMEMLEGSGVPRERIIVDPGLGGHQPAGENVALLHSLALFHGLGCPVIADCGGFFDSLGETGVGDGVRMGPGEVAFAALAQGVQIIAAPEPGEIWAAAAAFRAFADARIDLGE